MDLSPLLPVRALSITLRFTAPAHLRFFHQPALSGLLRTLMEGRLEEEPRLWLEAPESGRADYATGDLYRFHLYCCAGVEPLLEDLVARLRRLPADAPAEGQALGANLRFVSAHDLFSDERYRDAAHLFAYDAAALERETDFYRGEGRLGLRLLAPARLLLPKEGRPAKGEERFVRDRGGLLGELPGQRLYDALAALVRAAGGSPPLRTALGLECVADDIGWFDVAYRGTEGRAKPMGGIVGHAELAITDPQVLPLLVLGQYTGIGQRRTFGWGRYRLETPDGRGTRPPRRPLRSVAERAADPGNVELAYRAMRSNQGTGPEDDEEAVAAALAWAEHPGPVDAMLEEIMAGLRSGDYRPATLRGGLLWREGKAPRPLAVPPFADRVAQRAVMQVLRGDIDALLSGASYGYRRGISRMDARDRLQSLYRQGYQWLYEADIDDFFDTVSHARLHTRLESLLPDDPVVPLIMGWVAAPVTYRGERQERPAGLPQGAPLSPLLANLLLDDFDADLESLGFRLVRFADDFVVACRSREEAEAAARQVRASLAEIDLTLNRDKTRITRFDDGFRFLGYTFLGDLAVDTPRRARSAGGRLLLEELPPTSWLALLARRAPQVLEQEGSEAAPPDAVAGHPDGIRLQAPDTPCDEPCMLLVASEGSRVSTRAGRLRIATPDGGVHEQPWDALGAVLLLGRQRLTMPTLGAALDAGVPVHFATRGGRYQGVLASGAPGPDGPGLWLQQERMFGDRAFALPLARELVAARIHNQTEVLRQRARTLPALEGPLAALRRTRDGLQQVRGPAELNGIEGLAGRHYFEGLALIVPEEFGFEGRKRRPPPDPFNALLSLGYTLLHQRTDAVLRSAGLLPWSGLYHQGRGRHAALASDLLEPFRHLVERQALAMIKRGELVPGDFLVGDTGGCRLARPALRRYLEALSRRCLAPLEDAAGGETGSLYQHQWRMTRSLVELLHGRQANFRAFRVK